MTARVILTLATVLLLVLPVLGASRKQQSALPDPELIEYLGSFATAGGKSIDPLVFADEEKPVQPGTERRQPREQQPKKPEAKTRRESERTEQ